MVTAAHKASLGTAERHTGVTRQGRAEDGAHAEDGAYAHRGANTPTAA